MLPDIRLLVDKSRQFGVFSHWGSQSKDERVPTITVPSTLTGFKCISRGEKTFIFRSKNLRLMTASHLPSLGDLAFIMARIYQGGYEVRKILYK